jgi:hypothetical protein
VFNATVVNEKLTATSQINT